MSVGGRKLVVTFVAMALLGLAVAFGRVSGGEFSNALVAIVGLFCGANVGEHWLGRRSNE